MTRAAARRDNPIMGFFGKILVLAIVIAAAWFGYRWWQRLQSGQLERPRNPAPAPRNDPPPPPKPVDDMRACPVCGDFVAVNARRCERPTCPRG
ncbi:hypothetical protein [Reyranella sp. CPCC 100927]|uniref:hypothetical protein n=1 Tax=Reyranella sp. CPCC 100927 TaxID=2599616 RepID=UPI0011B4B81B|nr:hypothetical protein [Reyranella sp. CPCC 100927]TWT04061.1 hypothetical protein FQU96_27125 [Reyranella sp. CPCC 100927]